MKKEKISSGKLYKIFVYVALITLAISIIVPVIWVFMSSLKTNAEFQGSPWSLPASFYIQNFIDAFEKANMAEYFLNSVIVTALGLFLLVIIALPASYVLARFDFKGKKLINTAFMGGLFINVNYIVVPIFLMLTSWDDVVYDIIGDFFFLDNIVVLAIVYAATAIPFTVYLLSSYFRTLPKAYEEAAFIDGCGYFKTMMKVMAPMAKPSIITVILFNFLAFWNEYIIALTLMPGASKTLPVGLVTLSKGQMAAANYGQLYAGLVIVMLPTLILYIMVQKKLTQGMTLGGLKD
ncbi:carbohydrate ABC transporter permease [Candidatus Stoquefichus sp. SB1]|uniref:carbohydrate ABC transporter permease n=1 Tax=Candidatus Stoquefichus sp. SB1 TaxID=1658109 RepID=UPI00067E9C3A|nr:carbohydrate ABC transporter permease [Candidatus Stoquefichus sp. SB1]